MLLKRFLICAALLAPYAFADHGAPTPRLGGIALCSDPGSVKVAVLEAGGVRLPKLERRVRQEVLRALQARLARSDVVHHAAESCAGEPGFVLIGVSARYLDPKTYLGFPENSYTYVATGQVGEHAADATVETSLADTVYVASEGDLLEGSREEVLRRKLTGLGEAQVRALTQTWLEANRVSASRYVVFAAVALALVAARAVLTLTLAP